MAAKLGEVYEEADECRDWLEHLRDGSISHDAQLLQEAQELTQIFAKALKTTRQNTARSKDSPRDEKD